MARWLVDTGVWYAVFDSRDRPGDRDALDEFAAQVISITNRAVIPWPVTYETLRTRFVKNRTAIEGFERLLKSPRTDVLDDAPYREAAINEALTSALERGRPLSLVDCLLRVVIDDPQTRIDYFATYNVGDFQDVCKRRRIQIICPGKLQF